MKRTSWIAILSTALFTSNSLAQQAYQANTVAPPPPALAYPPQQYPQQPANAQLMPAAMMSQYPQQFPTAQAAPQPAQFPGQAIQQIAYNAPGMPPAAQLPGYAPAPAIPAPAQGDALTQMQQQLYHLQQELAAIRAQQVQQMNPVVDAPTPLFIDNDIEQANYADDKGGKKEEKKPDDPKAMSAKWNNGLELSSKDKNFKVHVGGRTQLDAIWYADSPDGFAGTGGIGDQDSVDFRRARLRVDGTMYKYYDFACEYEFLNTVNDNPGTTPSEVTGNIITAPAPTDLWIRAKELPIIGNLQFGNMKPQIGLEHITSSRYLDFIERSYNQDLFYGPFNNGFQPGVMAFDNYADENGFWAVGLFKHTTNGFGFNAGDGEYDLTTRLTYLPFYEDKGRYMLHLGMGGSRRDTDNNRTRFRARGSLRNGPPGPLNPNFVDTGTFFADSQSLISPELALVWGPWLFQAEYTGAWVEDAIGNAGAANGVNQGTVYFQGWYAEALYFLTGEHREYERKEARFGRVLPYQNAYLIRQPCNEPIWRTGAWQLGARYAKADLSDEGIRGGTTQDVTVGLNWFINPNFKYQWNYVWTHRTYAAAPGEGDIHGFGMRVAFDF